MPFAARHRNDPTPRMEPLPGLAVRHEASATVMAALQGRTEAEIQRRFDTGHRAYVAWRDGASAAWGWVATRTANIGELGSSFTIPAGERYLWNFVTLPTHRGQGIYPRLLGLPEATDDLAQCWRCVRAGRGAMSCAPAHCRCDYQLPESGCAA